MRIQQQFQVFLKETISDTLITVKFYINQSWFNCLINIAYFPALITKHKKKLKKYNEIIVRAYDRYPIECAEIAICKIFFIISAKFVLWPTFQTIIFDNKPEIPNVRYPNILFIKWSKYWYKSPVELAASLSTSGFSPFFMTYSWKVKDSIINP